MRALPLLLACLGCAAPVPPQEGPHFRRVAVPAGAEHPAAMLAVDVDRDGAMDLVVSGGEVHVLLGDGHGGFRRRATFDAGPNPAGLASADFDGDGWPDLAVANHDTDQVTVLLGGEGGTFRPAPGSPVRPPLSPHPHTVRACDLDGDGLADILVDDRNGHRMLLLPGRGDGRFGEPVAVPVGGDPYREPWVGDVDGDGLPDLVTPNPRSLAVLIGDGRGGFTPLASSPLPAPAPFAVAAGDVNGDGVVDLASLPGERTEGVTVLLGDGSGGFRPAPGSPVPGVAGPGRIASGDIDGDGYDDLVAGGWPGSTILLILGGADGLTAVPLEAGEHPWSVVVADLDGDGRSDIAAANEGSGDVTIFFSVGAPPPAGAARP